MAVDMLTLASMTVNMTSMKALAMVGTCCPPVLDAPIGAEDAETMAAVLGVLADPARLRLLSLIASCPGSEACGCDLTGPVGLSQPTVSHHLNVLHEAGLLDRERRGKWVYYRVRPEPLRALGEALSA
jgi:ArsR family transcriptional regulator, arsenate/arsenite/antimonite-responsive transcriptional repressor